MHYRVERVCWWSPNGLSIFRFSPGELLTPGDPRVAGGFFEVGTHPQNAWVTPVKTQAPSVRPAPSKPVQATTATPRIKKGRR